MNLKFLFLDLDDTLLDFGLAEHAAYTAALREMDIDPTPALLARYHVINNQHWERYERGELEREALLVLRHAQLLQELGIRRDPEELERRYRDKLGIGHYFVPGAPELLEYLSGRGYRLFLASNGVADIQYSRLESAGICPYFENIFISEDTGAHKPEQAYFDYCFARIPGFEKDRAMIIGDSLSSDIRGGKAAGIKTCWLNRRGLPAPAIDPPDLEIRQLSELHELL